jgi:ribonuclease HI
MCGYARMRADPGTTNAVGPDGDRDHSRRREVLSADRAAEDRKKIENGDIYASSATPRDGRGRAPSPGMGPAKVTNERDTDERRTATINFDGGGQAPRPTSAAAVVQFEGQRHEVFDTYPPGGTHNTAEYLALQLGLEHARALGATHVTVYGDSQLVVRQVRGEYRVKHPGLRPLHAAVRRLLDSFEDGWDIDWIRREANRQADDLGRRALKRRPREP